MASEALRQRLIRGLTQHMLHNARWQDFASAFQALAPADRTERVRVLLRGDGRTFATQTRVLVRNAVRTQAVAAVDAALMDGSLTVAELEDMLGLS